MTSLLLFSNWIKIKSNSPVISDTFNKEKDHFNYLDLLINNDYEEYLKERNNLLKEEEKNYFTYDVKELTYQERIVNQEIQKLRDEIIQRDKSPLLLDFYEGKKIIENSKLMNMLELMPKGAHLHLHSKASLSFLNIPQ